MYQDLCSALPVVEVNIQQSGPAQQGLSGSILIVASDAALRETLVNSLKPDEYQVEASESGEEFLGRIVSGDFDLVLLEVSLRDQKQWKMLAAVRHYDPLVPVIAIVAAGALDAAAAAMREGATNLALKPCEPEKLLNDVRKLVAEHRSEREKVQLKHALTQGYDFAGIVGVSPAILRVLDLVARVAPSRSTVLLQGETGTGKELIAKSIHINSPRRDRSFVPVNSGSMPTALLESTLFGHVKGAFTGALCSKLGLFDVANGGTLFLDEIANMSLDTQAKLLRVLQDRRFTPLGGVHEIQVDVRFIAASSVDIQQLVREGKFREDLYYRLNVITIELPPLRMRRKDITLLAEFFLRKFARENNSPVRRVAPDAMRRLIEYSWPGNVREFENVLERAVVLARGPVIGSDLICDHLRNEESGTELSLSELVEQCERRVITDALDRRDGNQAEAARLLRVPVITLRRKIKRLHVRVPRVRPQNCGPDCM